MDKEKKKKILDKLNKVKALAEKGVGGEKESAMRMYNELMEKYNISPDEVEKSVYDLERRWFGYSHIYEKPLLAQIIYKVTGSSDMVEYVGAKKRRKKIGCNCTEIEAMEINLLFSFYRKALKDDLDIFIAAFINKNKIFPDENARCYEAKNTQNDDDDFVDDERNLKILDLASSLDYKAPPRSAIEKE